MNPLVWLMRARRWAQHPPAWWRVRLVVGVIAACIAVAALEAWLGWPEALTPRRLRP